MGQSPAVLVILGAPRSGTSLLYRLLALHPQAAWISNYQRRLPRWAPISAINRIAAAAPRRRHRVWFGVTGDNAYRYNQSRSFAEWAFPQPVEGEPVFRAAGVPAVGGRQHAGADAGRLHSRLTAMTGWSGGSVLITKRIGHNRRIPLLDEILPDVRFVNLLRDGRAAALSCLKVDWWPDTDIWSLGTTPRRWQAVGKDPLELAARHWVAETRAIDAGLSQISQQRIFSLRYEDLVADPLETLRDIADFGGLTAQDPSWTSALARLSFPNRSSAALESLTAEQQESLAPARERLMELGYAR